MKKWLVQFLIGIMIIGIAACTNDSIPVKERNPNHVNSSQDKTKGNEPSPVEKFQSSENILDMPLNTKIPNNLPVKDHAFIVLGSALTDDGQMKETLLNRLKVALKASMEYPNSKIIVSGGVPEKGITEADVMYDWLVANNVNKDSIIKESSSTDTVENALLSLEIAKKEDVEAITLITSASHMRRAMAVFKEINSTKGSILEKSFSHIVYMDYDSQEESQNVTTKEKALIIRDIIRASGK